MSTALDVVMTQAIKDALGASPVVRMMDFPRPDVFLSSESLPEILIATSRGLKSWNRTHHHVPVFLNAGYLAIDPSGHAAVGMQDLYQRLAHSAFQNAVRAYPTYAPHFYYGGSLPGAVSVHRGGQVDIDARGPAAWLATTLSSIRASVDDGVEAEENDGSYISSKIADRAVAIFEAASHVLPGEPYLYTTATGNLVAEFQQTEKSRTIVVHEGYFLFSNPDRDEVLKGNYDNLTALVADLEDYMS